MINRLCIVGVGLIGGSLAKDLRRLGLCREVIGCSRSSEHLARARELGIIDAFDVDPAKAVGATTNSTTNTAPNLFIAVLLFVPPLTIPIFAGWVLPRYECRSISVRSCSSSIVI